MASSKNKKAFLALALVAIIVIALGASLRSFSSLSVAGYSTLFQGPKATFAGIEYNGKQYTQNSYGTASRHTMDNSLSFDSDGDSSGKPNLNGEMSSVFIPKESVNTPSWVPSPFILDQNAIVNPLNSYSWVINGKTYNLTSWNLRYYVTVNIEWDGQEKDQSNFWDTSYSNYYSNLGLWIKFDLTPTNYFKYQDSEQTYFAIASVRLGDNVALGGWDGSSKDTFGNKIFTSKNTECSVIPESAPSQQYMYYQLFGAGGYDEKAVATYQGVDLNPAAFPNQVYMRLTLSHFGLHTNIALLGKDTKGDVATWAFNVIVFSIGEWKVQDVQKDPGIANYGRFTMNENPDAAFLKSIGDWFSNPFNSVWIAIALIVILAIFAPGVLVALFGRRKK